MVDKPSHLEDRSDTIDREATNDVPSDMLEAGLLSIGECLDVDVKRKCVLEEFAATAT